MSYSSRKAGLSGNEFRPGRLTAERHVNPSLVVASVALNQSCEVAFTPAMVLPALKALRQRLVVAGGERQEGAEEPDRLHR